MSIRRRELIKQLEDTRGSKVIAYVTGDRSPASASIGDDAVRPILDVLRALPPTETLDVFLYSRGGAIDVPWRLATAFRQATKTWRLLVPFRANSAATLLALGADEIVLGRHGELGPIDPRFVAMSYDQSGRQIQSEVAVEDVMAYIRFLKDRAGLSDQAALTSGVSKLAERLDPVMLGNIYRTHSHIRDVARRMLLSTQNPPNESVMSSIVETLAEKVYAHGHAIGYKEAKETGLPVVLATGTEEQLLWDLYCVYEEDFRMNEPIDVAAELASVDIFSTDVILAAVESSETSFEFRGKFEARAKRQIPQQLNVAFNLNLQLPAGVAADAIPASVQQELANAQQTLFAQAQLAVQEALRSQAPIIGAEAAVRSAKWHKNS